MAESEFKQAVAKSKTKSAWKEAKKNAGKGFTVDVPFGDYVCVPTSAGVKRGSNNRWFANIAWLIVDGEYANDKTIHQTIWLLDPENPEKQAGNLKRAADELARLGFEVKELDDPGEIEDCLVELVKNKPMVLVGVWENKGYTNIGVRRILEDAYDDEESDDEDEDEKPVKKGRGRPKGSKNKNKEEDDEPTPKRGRGRPPKKKVEVEEIDEDEEEDDDEEDEPAPKKRGRPVGSKNKKTVEKKKKVVEEDEDEDEDENEDEDADDDEPTPKKKSSKKQVEEDEDDDDDDDSDEDEEDEDADVGDTVKFERKNKETGKKETVKGKIVSMDEDEETANIEIKGGKVIKNVPWDRIEKV